VHKDFQQHLDLEFEYKDHVLKFQDVSVSGTIAKGHATLYEPGWCDVRFTIDMKPSDVQEWVIEQFEDDDLDVPPWAYTDGVEILVEMRDHIEQQIYVD